MIFKCIKMFKVSKTTNKELNKFEVKEWPYADMEHYGKKVKYNNKSFMFKATVEKEIVGCIKGKLESGVLYIDYLIVAHDKKGNGIGKMLSLRVEEFGKINKAHKIHLITGKGWKAEKFYQKLGYKQIATLPNHNFKKDFIIYEKFI